jgi:apolipoprotein N-acyltransferase
MRIPRFKNCLLALLSGIMLGASVNYLLFWLAWISLIPLFIALEGEKPGESFITGLFTGIASGAVCFQWMYPVTQRYTGAQTPAGIFLIALCAIYFSLFTGGFAYLYNFIAQRFSPKGKYNLVKYVLTACSLWIIFEWVRMKISIGMPWFLCDLSVTQTKCNYLIQLSPLTGALGISAVIVSINYLFFSAFQKRSIKLVCYALGLLGLNFVIGYIAVNFYSPEDVYSKKVVIISENIKAETRWSDKTGDSLAAIFFRLNSKAASLKPDLIVWSESALPWTFSYDDALIHKALSITYESKASHLVGMLTESTSEKGKVYNSAYSIDYDGKVTSRYDKKELLKFLEEPLFENSAVSVMLPFFANTGYKNALRGDRRVPVSTPAGSAGILLCSESLSPTATLEYAENGGVGFLVNMSNDAWFENTELTDLHFYCCRLRAVENRKDIIINSNRGSSGFIDSKGEILIKRNSDKPFTLSADIHPNLQTTPYSSSGNWIIFPSLIFVLINAKDKNKNTKNKNKNEKGTRA